MCLSLSGVSTSTPTRGGVVKGIRAVSIMDTLLAGESPPQPSRDVQPLYPPVPAAAPPAHRARGRTPDWIKRIFDCAKRGHLEQLSTRYGLWADVTKSRIRSEIF
ncbi:hypothetical protein B566_EDAN017605 [Ephemera danica]|nr:hypothetical protein B566_EDAN017605 [Ephemera danica]